jgi:CheY-like chemotaxis protein
MSQGGAILYVEDDVFTGRMMELQFRNHGFEVTLVNNGEDALAALDQASFDLILSDVMMPKMTGLELLARIRETHAKENLPVILVTALDNTSRIMDGLKQGANDFLAKTNEFGIVLARVEMHLEMKRLREGAAAPGEETGLRVSPDALWRWNVAADQLVFSARLLSLLGYAGTTFAGNLEAWFSQVHDKDVARLKAALAAHQQRKKPWLEADFRMKHGAGSYLWMRVFGIAMFGKDGSMQRVMGSMCRISREKVVQVNVKAAAAELQALREQLDAQGQASIDKALARLKSI